ncbi:MAG: ethanolamine ammonia-lyase reactivating factor EutA [Candidatus Melainabacteria bacterium]|nr:ethanolamine ammonia-lyase reactivating factor EutA [Candidatus Melainabacteria bacterium]
MTSFLTVGIDVGTTSTHLTFTRLTIVNAALVNQSPLPKIESREVIFRSSIHLTPLTLDGTIDAQSVFALIEKEYETAAIKRDDIKVGAAIVTGETALKRNAREVIEKLCLLSGDLVAVSAGPHLEAVLSARGSGAAAASAQNHSTVLNIDIGGGTMNLALYKNGVLVSTHCLGIGGRCVQFKKDEDQSTASHFKSFDLFEVSAINESGRMYLADGVEVGTKLKRDDLFQLSNAIASDVVRLINGETHQTKLKRLPLTSIENSWSAPDQIWLCGGVAEFGLDPELDRFKFSDLGGLLADALISKLNAAGLFFKIPLHPIRATVTGAGMYSMQVSGSTIDFDIEHLPLRNVPLVRPFEHKDQMSEPDEIIARIESSIARIDPESRFETIAFELPSLERSLDYVSLKSIADGLALAALKMQKTARLRPFVLVVREDLAMALGQLFRQSMQNLQAQKPDARSACPLIVLDGISTTDGDFIDIGKPVSLDANGIARTVPVVLKTLIFGNSN